MLSEEQASTLHHTGYKTMRVVRSQRRRRDTSEGLRQVVRPSFMISQIHAHKILKHWTVIYHISTSEEGMRSAPPDRGDMSCKQGRRMKKVDPTPSVDSNQRRPPCPSTNSRLR
jgi:hypothetical protein